MRIDTGYSVIIVFDFLLCFSQQANFAMKLAYSALCTVS